MKLLYTKRSPYARKIRVMAIEKKITLELVEEDLTNKSSRLLESNPLGKIPTLILDNGESLCDSPNIGEYLDSLNGQPVLIPRQGPERFRILHLTAIADGLMDLAVAVYMEKIRHPDNFNETFIKAQEETILRTFGFFEQHVKELEKLSLAPIAVASAIGYINFRLPHIGIQKYPKLSKWFEEFSKRPSLAETKPG